MSKKAAARIKQVRLAQPTPFSRGTEMLEHLSPGGSRINMRPYTVVFDADPRFLRVEIEGDTTHLIPLHNVTGIQIEPEETDDAA